ncbi:MAG: zinc dependent phospholipase C family protein [Bacteroidota bacterium]
MPLLLFSFLLSSGFLPVHPPVWGFYGHRKINRQAVYILPPEMQYFFKRNIDYLTEHAVDADKRRYVSRFEAVRHYIDLDVHGEMPFDHIPRNWSEALFKFSDFYFLDEKSDTLSLFIKDSTSLSKGRPDTLCLHPKLSAGISLKAPYRDFRRFFTQYFLPNYYEDTWTAPCDSLAKALNISADSLSCTKLLAIDHLSEHGVLPWHLQAMLRRLTDAFSVGDEKKIRRYAADIGHYIGDAHVPLHTTENYNGQLTGQDGIHAFWESRLPELFADERYDFWVGKATFIENPKDYFWNIVLESHSLVDSVLAIESALRRQFPSDRQMCQERRGQTMVRTQCPEYAAAYDSRMGGMVEQRMRAAVRSVGSIWYTAWILAGQPDLRSLGPEVIGIDSTGIGEISEKRKFSISRKHE